MLDKCLKALEQIVVSAIKVIMTYVCTIRKLININLLGMLETA